MAVDVSRAPQRRSTAAHTNDLSETQRLELVDEQRLKGGVHEAAVQRPAQIHGDAVAVDEQAGKEQVEEHRERAHEVRHARVLDGDADEEHRGARSERKEHEDAALHGSAEVSWRSVGSNAQEELPEDVDLRHKAHRKVPVPSASAERQEAHWCDVHDGAKDERRNDTQRQHVED
jgi:hypothetical protein